MTSLNNATDISVIAGGSIAIGTLVGRLWAKVGKARRTDQQLAQAQSQTINELTWAIAGKPADQWGPRRVGLIEQMTNLTERIDRHEKWHDRFEDAELKPQDEPVFKGA